MKKETFDKIEQLDKKLTDLSRFIDIDRVYDAEETKLILMMLNPNIIPEKYTHSQVYYCKDTDWHTDYGIRIYYAHALILDHRNLLCCPTKGSSSKVNFVDGYLKMHHPEYIVERNLIRLGIKREEDALKTKKLDLETFKMSFGKHKGLTLDKINEDDPNYLTWVFSDKCQCDSNIKDLLKEYFLKDKTKQTK